MNEKFEEDYPRYVGDEMPEKERREFERQVVSDPELAEEMFADLNVASKLERSEVVKLAPRWWRWAAPLAAAALILVAVNVWGPEINETGPVMRGSASVVELVAPVGLVDALPVRFEWQPHGAKVGSKGASIKIDTTDKAHNLIRIRSQTKNSLIVVSSASNPFSTESWTFIFNFPVETLIATRVQSNISGVKGEVITYDCHFHSLNPPMGDAGKPIG